ncbi:cobalamin-dependent protein [Halobacillus yeomjeoni]|uniref:cobalamin B12-binding domain-containing protein n=1 Tax=Halobacillus yeomjeoni TaxID=311194 RepID=UPI001CD74A8B|nr:cobalamin-dependent protein [Halobacillus yeomjeoni]MCA0984558.1 cobalamin-dependent protein [Halobacillus yeomjeoni]
MINHHETLAHLFLDGEEEKALEYVETLLIDHPQLYLFEDILTPAMYYIGELWEKNKITVADEHLATGICDFIISKLETNLSEGVNSSNKQPKVMLFGVEEEQHYIGLKMAANTFRAEGWKVRYLGPNLRLEHSLSQLHKFKPDVIGISAALSYRLSTLKNIIHELAHLDWRPKLLIGGRMAKSYGLSDLESNQVIVIRDLKHLEEWLQEGVESIYNETS